MTTHSFPFEPEDTAFFKHSEGISYSSLGPEVLVVDLTHRRSHRMFPSAALIFLACNGKHSLLDIAKKLTQEFEVNHEEALRDTKETLTTLLSEKLIEPL